MQRFALWRGAPAIAVLALLLGACGPGEPSDLELLVPGGSSLTSYVSGMSGGYYHSMWTQGPGEVVYRFDADGGYTVAWADVENWVGGRGWNPGSNKVVGYEADYRPDGNSYLALYGWTTEPLIEYYVVESWGSWRPPGGTSIGTVESDGGTYDIYKTRRYEQPSILGPATFDQFWSVRRVKKPDATGEITVANHFNAWEAFGLELGTHDYQIMATEGYQSSGYSQLRVWEVTDSE